MTGRSVARAGLVLGRHRQDGSERRGQHHQQEQHIHEAVPWRWSAVAAERAGLRSSANMASILDLISAVLMAPGRRIGRVVIEAVGVIEAVVMCPTFRRVRGRHPPVCVHHHHSYVIRFTFSVADVVHHSRPRRHPGSVTTHRTPPDGDRIPPSARLCADIERGPLHAIAGPRGLAV